MIVQPDYLTVRPNLAGGRENYTQIRGRFPMNVDRAVLAFAGGLLLLSLALAWFFSAYWLLLTAFVGLNMLQSAFTGFCPAAIAFRKLGLKEGPAFKWPPANA
jgi:hypothetical protein